ncbi:hypothetical protein BJ742DRAFT_814010 [Cladochytrium replicatum]|nr:hypothetical protein BJ742DRAFT_814010 [Cladochytrium replicatum]
MAELLHEEVLDQVNHTSDHSRIVAIAVNSSSHSRYAFEWALSNLVKADGDQVVLLNVRPLVSLPILESLISTQFLQQWD